LSSSFPTYDLMIPETEFGWRMGSILDLALDDMHALLDSN